jgi:hypothetical protein
MRRFGVLLASAALGTALAASGPALAFGGGHMGGGFGGGGFGGGHFGGFAGRGMAMGGFNRGFGFNRSFAGVNRGFTGRSMAMGGFNRGFGFNRAGRFGRFNRGFNRGFASAGPFWGWDWGYPYWDDAYYGYGYPDYAYDLSPAAIAPPLAAAAPADTRRRRAIGEQAADRATSSPARRPACPWSPAGPVVWPRRPRLDNHASTVPMTASPQAFPPAWAKGGGPESRARPP